MSLFLGLLFGAIGTGYLVYAKKEHNALFLATGVALIVYPYFVDSVILTVVIGVGLAALPVVYARMS